MNDVMQTRKRRSEQYIMFSWYTYKKELYQNTVPIQRPKYELCAVCVNGAKCCRCTPKIEKRREREREGKLNRGDSRVPFSGSSDLVCVGGCIYQCPILSHTNGFTYKRFSTSICQYSLSLFPSYSVPRFRSIGNSVLNVFVPFSSVGLTNTHTNHSLYISLILVGFTFIRR